MGNTRKKLQMMALLPRLQNIKSSSPGLVGEGVVFIGAG
jgi:hypothetical protein